MSTTNSLDWAIKTLIASAARVRESKGISSSVRARATRNGAHILLRIGYTGHLAKYDRDEFWIAALDAAYHARDVTGYEIKSLYDRVDIRTTRHRAVFELTYHRPPPAS